MSTDSRLASTWANSPTPISTSSPNSILPASITWTTSPTPTSPPSRNSTPSLRLLPAANYFLGLGTFPPARKLIDSGVAVALATDYNPGTSPTTSMPFVLSVACTHMKMSPAEAITAATFNGAFALSLQDRKGSLEPGKDADIAIFDATDYRELAYWFGVNRAGQRFSMASDHRAAFREHPAKAFSSAHHFPMNRLICR